MTAASIRGSSCNPFTQRDVADKVRQVLEG